FAAISQILLSFSTTLSMLYLFTLCATFGAISAQILIPFASTISPPESSAATVGKLMSGLVMGIILSRTFAGFVSSYWSWYDVCFCDLIYFFSYLFLLRFRLLFLGRCVFIQRFDHLALCSTYVDKSTRYSCSGRLNFW